MIDLYDPVQTYVENKDPAGNLKQFLFIIYTTRIEVLNPFFFFKIKGCYD